MGQNMCWCGGRERFSLSVCEMPKSGELTTGGGTPTGSVITPTRAMRKALAEKAGVAQDPLFAPQRFCRKASAAEADARWQATREEWERSVKAALEGQSSRHEEAEEPVSKEDERRAALAMFRLMSQEDEKEKSLIDALNVEAMEAAQREETSESGAAIGGSHKVDDEEEDEDEEDEEEKDLQKEESEAAAAPGDSRTSGGNNLSSTTTDETDADDDGGSVGSERKASSGHVGLRVVPSAGGA